MKKITLCLTIIITGCMSLKNQLVEVAPVVVAKENPTEINIAGVTGTTYNLEVKQCDANPFETADGSIINPKKINKLRWVALSRDLIKDVYRDKKFKNKNQWKGKIQFGDTITIVSDNKKLCGQWVVKDCMNKRFTKRVDFMQDRETGFIGKWENLTIVVNS